MNDPTFLTKLSWNLPWLIRYPLSRVGSMLEQTAFEKKHVIFTIANHFEPGWSERGVLDHKSQMGRLEEYHKLARATGEAVRDADGTKFRHTNFYPAEQYHPEILEIMAEMQAEGLGETEVHLHHGVEQPDTAENLTKMLVDFRDTLAVRHKLLSQKDGIGAPMYAFVHGNLALANSCGGRFCGVDNEMEILRNKPLLPLIFTGPLVFNWTRTIKGIPVPRIEDGALTANQGLDAARFRRWTSANVTVAGRSDLVFVKLYCHGFFDHDQSTCIGEDAKRFFNEIIEIGDKSGAYKVHFASAREAFNIAAAAIDGQRGEPNQYRDHRLRSIMAEVA